MHINEEELKLLEERKIWEKNSEYLYEFVVTTRLPSPSLCVDSRRKGSHVQYALATHYEEVGKKNEISLYQSDGFDLPIDPELRQFKENTEYSGFPWKSPMEEIKKWEIEGEANRIRFNPRNLLGAATSNGNVVVASIDDLNSLQILEAHDAECWDLRWSDDQLLSVGEDRSIALMNPAESSHQIICRWKDAHEEPIQGVSWNHSTPHTFVTVGDDGKLKLWDSRQPGNCVESSGEDFPFNCVDVHPDSPFIVAAGGIGKEVILWDIRQISRTLHHMNGHTATISALRFHPKKKELIISAADDRRVIMWDLKQSGAEQQVVDSDDGPPELMFSHGGHMSNVTDVAWVDCSTDENTDFDLMVASTSLAGDLHLWLMNHELNEEDATGEKCPFAVE